MNPHILLDIMIGLLIFVAISTIYSVYYFFTNVGGDIEWFEWEYDENVDNIDTESK